MENEGVSNFKRELIENARKLCVKGKGILAADESEGTIGKRFADINLENTEQNRRAYRELLFTTEGLEDYISGVILYDETVYQKTKDGTPFVTLLQDKNIIPGIKVDKGTKLISGTKQETATQGLDNLGERCAKYYKEGCRFAKWRAVLKISIAEKCPSPLAIEENAHGLARYAQICQENGIVPIIEPEVLVDGTHTIEECAAISEKVYAEVMKKCIDYDVLLEGALLKPNMILAGKSNENKESANAVAWLTIRTLSRTIPPALPGIMFLSGGQSEEDAALNLNEMNKVEAVKPWNLSFSFGRALQKSCLAEWLGMEDNVKAAQKKLLQVAEVCALATEGKYKGGVASSEDLHVKNYTY